MKKIDLGKWFTTSGKGWYRNWIVKNIVVAGSAMLLILSILFFLAGRWTRHGSEFETPDFSGLVIDEAINLAEAEGLKLDISDSVYIPRMKPGLIFKQNPTPGSKVKRGRRVLLSINSLKPRMVEMPLVTGFFLREAHSVLSNNSLKVGRLIYVEDIATNNVLEQIYKGTPIRAGKKIRSQSEIDLRLGISKEDNTTFVPDMTGMPYSVARDVLVDNSLNMGRPKFSKGIGNYMDTLNAVVWKQIPEPKDTAVPLGTEVVLYFKNAKEQ